MAEHSRDGRLLISTTLVVNMLDGKVMFECKNIRLICSMQMILYTV